jgi:diguanylate cyclase (GGDEF)-like protein/PAS domain S-box-containing protein
MAGASFWLDTAAVAAVATLGAAGWALARRWRAARDRRRLEFEHLQQAAVVFESTNEAILVTDARSRILAVNRAYETITGYAAAEAIGRNPSFQQSGHHDAAFYRALWERLLRDGAWQGELWNRRKNGEAYAVWQSISGVKDASGQVTRYVSLFTDITPIKAAEGRLYHLAHHDPLTGLPNRLLFATSLEQAMARCERHQGSLALLFLDLDHFKLVNDTLGHPAGDTLLQVIAQRLRDGVRAQDAVARLGGDEFTVLMEDVGTRDEAARAAKALLALVSQPVELEGRTVVPSASVGIALYPQDAGTAVDLNRAADAALYRAKANGRATHAFYTEELTRQAGERLAIESRLREAAAQQQFVLHYQPQFDLQSGALVGFEALLRWKHPEQGLLAPDRFIAVAEQSHLISVLSAWVIDEACRQARAWLDAGLSPHRVSVNISGREFLHDHIVETIGRALCKHGLDGPHGALQLEVEITETVLHASTRSAAVLQSLRAMGVRVAIDDFGTGYSSLSVLKHLPIDALKIDRLFAQGLPGDSDNHAISRAIISMAHSLGLEVVAEGVETPAQHDCLRALGCDQVQGYLTGRPMPAAEATAWLAGPRAATAGS